jgi:transposase-like protein
VKGSIYGVVLTTNVRRPLFPEPSDHPLFEAILARALERYRARLHAYAWLDQQAHLAIQVHEAPIGRIVQQAVGPYSRSLSRRYGRPGHHFGRAYRAILLKRTEHLPELVRYIHLAPVMAGKVADPGDYVGSSHRAYLGLCETRWLTTLLVYTQLAPRGFVGTEGYRRFVAQGRAADSAEARSGGHGTSQAALCHWLRQVESGRPALEQIIEAVCRRLGLVPQDLQSSWRPALPLARALIAWHATQGGGLSLAAVARRLDRSPSTLHAAMRRHRALRPRFFDMPLAQLIGDSPRGDTAGE